MNRAASFFVAIAIAAGCASSSDAPRPAPAAPPPKAPARAILPETSAAFAPSEVRVSGGKDPGERLADVDTCESCHADVAAQWRASVHAFASFNNPIYRTVIDRFRADRGVEKSRFCGGCHDIALLADGAMDKEIAAKDLRAHAGITCRTCHGISGARPDGNGSYDLDASEIPIPTDGDAASVKRHKDRVAPDTLRTSAMCGSCHRAFLDETTGNTTHLVGQDDYTPWARSEYAGSRGARVDTSVARAECRDCHMLKEDALMGDKAAKNGKVSSHRFLGAHTWLAAMRGDRDQLERVKAFLAQAASIDVPSVAIEGKRAVPLTGLGDSSADAFKPAAGDRVVAEVVVRNRGAGHRFPGGVMDAQDTWIELVVEDAKGRRIAEAGTQHAAGGDDPTAHRFTSAMIDEHGKPLAVRETQLFRANAYNHTIPPRDAEAVRYSFELPAGFDASALPLKLVARLEHRTRNMPLQRAACAESKSDRSRAFGREGLKRVSRNLDPCTMQPVVEIARAEVLAGGAAPAATARSWEREIDRGLALLHSVQENLDDARPSFERALAHATNDGERAAATWGLAQLAASQGNTDDALRLAKSLEALAPGHAAIGRVRGEALYTQWRWAEATPFFAESAAASPRDDYAWSHFAVVAGGASKHDVALDAAQRALALQPRDADALRVQALSIEALGGADKEAAMRAYLARRTPDDAPKLRSLCNRDVPGCVLERNPVHVHAMRAGRPEPVRKP